MKFDLHKPCANCPFRTDCPPAWLGHERASDIAQAVAEGSTFQCHKTLEDAPQMCAGALLVSRRDQAGFSGAISLACAVGWLEPDRLDEGALVFDSLEAFIEHHAGLDQDESK